MAYDNVPQIQVPQIPMDAPQFQNNTKAIVEAFKGIDDITFEALDRLGNAMAKGAALLGNGAANVVTGSMNLVKEKVQHTMDSAKSALGTFQGMLDNAKSGLGAAKEIKVDTPTTGSQSSPSAEISAKRDYSKEADHHVADGTNVSPVIVGAPAAQVGVGQQQVRGR